MATSRVYVLYTGGTFGMEPSPDMPGNPLVPMPLDRLKNQLPNPNALKADAEIEVYFDGFDRIIDSSNMTPADWVRIGNRIYENYDRFDGFVIIQGTDTLSYTASALSFMFENLNKPIVITGSQLPLTNGRTDATQNYMHSLMVAAHRVTGLPKISEVVVVFADKILRGCRTRKMSASGWAGFASPNAPQLGDIGEHIRIYEEQLRPAPASDLEVQFNTALVTEVLDISLYPGLTAEHLKSILGLDSVKGVVLRTFGTGNAPESDEFLSALSDGIKKGDKTVVNITQCPIGSVEMGLYAASVGLLDIGVISGLDMTPEAALTKLMVILGTRIGDQIKVQMQINQRGEQSQNLFHLIFKAPKERLSQDIYSDYVLPDRRFNRNDLIAAVLRIEALRIDLDPKEAPNPALHVFMNYPKVRISDLDVKLDNGHPRLVCTINLERVNLGGVFLAVELLSKDKVKNIIGEGDIVLTLVPTEGVSFSFEGLSMSLFTKA